MLEVLKKILTILKGKPISHYSHIINNISSSPYLVNTFQIVLLLGNCCCSHYTCVYYYNKNNPKFYLYNASRISKCPHIRFSPKSSRDDALKCFDCDLLKLRLSRHNEVKCRLFQMTVISIFTSLSDAIVVTTSDSLRSTFATQNQLFISLQIQ